MSTCIKFQHEWRGPHVHVDVFAGSGDGTMQLAGRLVFNRDEWDKFSGCLATAVDMAQQQGIDLDLMMEKRT